MSNEVVFDEFAAKNWSLMESTAKGVLLGQLKNNAADIVQTVLWEMNQRWEAIEFPVGYAIRAVRWLARKENSKSFYQRPHGWTNDLKNRAAPGICLNAIRSKDSGDFVEVATKGHPNVLTRMLEHEENRERNVQLFEIICKLSKPAQREWFRYYGSGLSCTTHAQECANVRMRKEISKVTGIPIVYHREWSRDKKLLSDEPAVVQTQGSDQSHQIPAPAVQGCLFEVFPYAGDTQGLPGGPCTGAEPGPGKSLAAA